MAGPLDAIFRFIESGGPVLWMILFVAALLFALLLERFWYVYVTFPRISGGDVDRWQSRQERHSWQALRIKTLLLSTARMRLEAQQPVIRMLVAVLPMLGLLGTVIGMIQLFDVMRVTGSSNARAMAGGISMATISTMAGMVMAVVGIFSSTRLQRINQLALARFADRLTEDDV